MTKEKEVMSNVLKLYKDMPYLWNKNDGNYCNKYMRLEGYKALLSVYKDMDDKATIKTMKKKIDNLRTYYMKEVKKVKKSKRTGASSGDIYVPTIWYYDYFRFLDSNTKPCGSVTDTIKDEDSLSLSSAEDHTQMSNASGSTSNEISFKITNKEDPLKLQQNTFNENSFKRTKKEDPFKLQENIGSTSNENSFKRTKKEHPLKLQQSILDMAPGLMKTKEEDWELLGRSIGMQLRDLDHRQHIIARKLISDIIYYATLNKLGEESFVGITATNNH